MKKWNCILFAILIISQLIGCGQSGKLYLPEGLNKNSGDSSSKS